MTTNSEDQGWKLMPPGSIYPGPGFTDRMSVYLGDRDEELAEVRAERDDALARLAQHEAQIGRLVVYATWAQEMIELHIPGGTHRCWEERQGLEPGDLDPIAPIPSD